MQYTTIALTALASTVYAQSCTTSSFDGTFQLNPVNVTSGSAKRSIQARQSSCDSANALVVSLQNGALTDSKGRIGSIVANYQFQFDGPPAQAGALVTDGYTICGNNTLASGGSALWYQCSDNTRTSIYGPNLSPVGDACYHVYYEVVPCNGGSSSASGVATMSDGQPTVTSCVPVTTMSDGQPVSSCPATSSCVPVTTMSDGQPVVSSCPSATATSTCVPVTTMSDGQPVVSSCPSAAATSTCVPITTMSDGQPVVSSCPSAAPTSTCVPITTMSDGQPVVSSCPTSASTAVLGQSADGQVVATGSMTATSVPSGYLSVNGGSPLAVDSRIGAAIAGAFALFML